MAAKRVEVAQSYLYVREQPAGSNRSPEIDRWLTAVGAPLGSPWCAAFMYACLVAGLPFAQVRAVVQFEHGNAAVWIACQERGRPRLAVDDVHRHVVVAQAAARADAMEGHHAVALRGRDRLVRVEVAVEQIGVERQRVRAVVTVEHRAAPLPERAPGVRTRLVIADHHRQPAVAARAQPPRAERARARVRARSHH